MLNDYVIPDALLGAIDMISVGAMGLVCLLVLVCAILAAKTWHWVNVVFLILTMIAGVLAAMGMGRIYTQRTADLSAYAKAKQRLERAEESLEKATLGDKLAANYQPGTLRYASQQLSRAMVGRGRAWNGGTVTAEGDQRKFTFTQPRDIALEGELKDFILHAFQERPVNDQPTPVRYIGTVRVNAESGNDLTLEAVELADTQLFATPQGTWSLFEKMPQDRRGTFRDAILAQAQADPNNELLQTFALSVEEAENNADAIIDITAFRTILQQTFLQAKNLGYDPRSAEYENLIDRYSFDGIPLGKIESWIEANSGSRINPRFEPLPQEKFYRLRFNAKSTRPYAVDSTGSIQNDGLFAIGGGSVVPQLKAGSDIAFEPGDEVLVDSLSAEGYSRGPDSTFNGIMDTEDVEKIDEIYIRQLVDFPYEFAQSNQAAISIFKETKRLEQNAIVQNAAIEDAQKQVANRDQQLSDAREDQEKLEGDLTAISAARAAKEATVAANNERIASLQANLDELYKKIRAATLEIARRAFTSPSP